MLSCSLPWDKDQYTVGPDGVDNSISYTALISEWVLISEVETLEKLCGLLLSMLSCLQVTKKSAVTQSYNIFSAGFI